MMNYSVLDLKLIITHCNLPLTICHNISSYYIIMAKNSSVHAVPAVFFYYFNYYFTEQPEVMRCEYHRLNQLLVSNKNALL